MNEIIKKHLDVYIKKKRKNTKIIAFLALLVFSVSIVTTYSLKKPAETISADTICMMEEHIHQEACQNGCNKIQHRHFQQCYEVEKCPQQLIDVFGIVEVIPYDVTTVDEVIVDNQNDLTINVEHHELSNVKASSSNSLNDYPYEYLTLHYNAGNGNVLITDGMVVPANASLILQSKLLLTVEDVQNCNGELYYTIPEQMKNNVINQQVTENNVVIANAELVSDNLVKIKFTQDWLNNNTNLSGAVNITFVCHSKLDTNYKDDNDMIYIPIIDKEYNIKLSNDWQNEACDIEIIKSVPVPVETEDGDFLEYTLTVKIPKDSIGSPNVRVVDRFQTNIDWAQEYIGVSITPSELTSSDPGIAPVETKDTGKTPGQVYITNLDYNSIVPDPQANPTTANKIPQMIWKIGPMEPGETRTLTYRCRVNPKYNFTKDDNKKTTTNKASAYSNTILKNESTSAYQYDMAFIAGEHRKSQEYVINDDGSVLVTYTLQFGVSSENDYTMNNIHLWDNLYNSTPKIYQPYIHIVDGSMHLYEEVSDGGEYVEVDFSTLNPHDPSTNPVLNDNGSFSIYMGDFKPGMTKRFVYQILIDKGIFTTTSNNIVVQNRFESYSDDRAGGPNSYIDGFNSDKITIGQKTWTRKIGDVNEMEEAVDIQIPADDEVYMNNFQLVSDQPASYHVPEGSYKYYVVVNEKSDFDMTFSTFTDTITDIFKYVGYVKVTAIPTPETPLNFSGMSDKQIALYLEEHAQDYNAVVKWYDIDGLSTFTFEPDDIGLEGKYTYLLTYYARAKNMNAIQQENITNKFEISGVVGDGYYFPPEGLYVEENFTVVGNNNYAISKDSWYYDSPMNGDRIYNNGEMYWILKLEGPLFAGIQIKDEPDQKSGQAMHTFWENGIAGLYCGSLTEGTNIAGYFDLADFEANTELKKLDHEQYFRSEVASDRRSMTLTLVKDLILEEGEAAYIVLRNEPNSSLNFNTHIDYRTYENNFYYRSHETSNWIEGNKAYLNASTKRGVFKNAVSVYEVKKDVEKNDVEYINIAQGLLATSSGGFQTNNPITNITDGNENTLWVRTWTDGDRHKDHYPCIITLPLNKTVYVDEVELVLERSQLPFKFYIEVTLKDGTKKIVLDKRDNTGNLSESRYNAVVNAEISEVVVNFESTTMADGVPQPIPAAKELKVLVEAEYVNSFTYETTYRSDDRKNDVHPEDNLLKSSIQKPGVYIEWIVNVNWDGSMNDELTMLDYLPEDVELVYVRYFDYGTDYDVTAYNFPMPMVIPIDDYENNQDWEKFDISGSRGSKQTQSLNTIYYYNQTNNEVSWKINNMQKGGEPYKRNAQFQVVAKVVNPDILMSNTGLDVINKIEVKDKYNRIVEDDCSVKVSNDSLSKDVTQHYEDNKSNYLGVVPFELFVNENGMDLDPSKDRLVLIDKMSPLMVFLEESLVILDTNTNRVLDKSEYRVSLEYLADGKTNVRFVLPDETPLKITYDTRINVEPNVTVPIKNELYWEGYSDEHNQNYTDESYDFDLGITVEVNAKPSLTVLKKDQDDLNKGLEGAEFELVAVTYENGTFKENGTVYKQTTNAQGVVEFSTSEVNAERYMEYNTIYRLTETKAPNGYISDEKPYYFTVASEVVINGVPTLPTFPQGVDVYTQNADYVYTKTNERGKIILEKQFVNDANEIQTSFADGTFNFGIYEVSNPLDVDPFEIITITYKQGKATYYKDGLAVSSPSFNNLNVGSTYYIYELDKDMKPIVQNETLFALNNSAYVVHYDTLSGIKIPDNANIAITKTIKNEITYKLPETGGNGKDVYILFGLFFASIALYGLKRRKVFSK